MELVGALIVAAGILALSYVIVTELRARDNWQREVTVKLDKLLELMEKRHSNDPH